MADRTLRVHDFWPRKTSQEGELQGPEQALGPMQIGEHIYETLATPHRSHGSIIDLSLMAMSPSTPVGDLK